MSFTKIILWTYSVFYLLIITTQNPCSWSSWSSTPQCQWINYHCLKGYHRYCLCNDLISVGSACSGNNALLKYIETKPFVSNFVPLKGICYKHNCPTYKDWCPWESWSYWEPLTNETCERRRVRKCCESQPKSGYTKSKSNNYGCFISNSEQAPSDYEKESMKTQCSMYKKWYVIMIYVGISIACLAVICLICRCTKSSNNKFKSKAEEEEVCLHEHVISAPPTAPVDPPNTSESVPDEISKEALTSSPGFPITPPSYDETVRFNSFSTVPSSASIHGKMVEEKNIKDLRDTEDVRHHTSTGNLPPPSYTIYSRNPVLFEN